MQFVDKKLVERLYTEAESSERLRAFHRFHDPNDMLNRLLIAGVSGSYVAPHRHADKFEAFSHVEGAVIVAEFDDNGALTNAYDLSIVPYVELTAGTWHTLVYTSERWAVMEFGLWKDVYDPSDKEFAPWAPQEGDVAAPAYSEQLSRAAIAMAHHA